jgi:hypothetical protein
MLWVPSISLQLLRSTECFGAEIDSKEVLRQWKGSQNPHPLGFAFAKGAGFDFSCFDAGL